MKYKDKIDYKLYLVTDRDILNGRMSLAQAVEQAIQGGATLVQLREKKVSSLELYNIACEIKEVTDSYNIPLIINDRLDIALAVDAAGLHVGQQDLPASVARRLLGDSKILGVSASTLEQALKAEQDGADYVGVGAVFPTDTKKDAEHVNVDALIKIRASLCIPMVAIGGINAGNVELLKDTGINGVAVVSAILGQKDIKNATQRLLEKINWR